MSEKRDIRTLFKELGETSSLHGIPKIVSSRQLIVKALWCILLLGTMSVFVIQLHGLFAEFYSYPTKTSVRLNFRPLAFPAMTFCNMNPLKLSHLSDFETLWEIDNYQYIADNKDDWGLSDSYLSQYLGEDVLEDHNNTRDKYDAWKTRFLTEFRNLSAENRSNVGHQKEDFIHSAVFSGHRMKLTSFKKVLSHVYGNCYTLDEDKLIARGSGHKNSLKIVFNIETEEYLEDYTSAYGVRMVLHEKGTYPLPEDEGLTLSSRFETHIGLRMSRVLRLGGKYGDCTNGNEFEEKYHIKYTVPVCHSMCEIENLKSKCQCIPPSSLSTVDKDVSRLCDADDDETCIENVIDDIHDGNIQCDCYSRCNEDVFSTTYSSRVWPHKTYLKKVLLQEACKRNVNKTGWNLFTDICYEISENIEVADENLDKIASNFLAVYIYFEDLNYEIISEEPLYNTLRFLSDIGGAMGLYMGASVLTYVEILQVALEVFLFFKQKWMRTTPIEKFSS
ncbi:amiloride-sensitive sodium channel subunit gamma-2-like [Mercenaria mercenaria]|uniref:amiloride-sensitive sodium channel subunit gamma-2-like n=1 Tax=Mercenaria mercenaria TaxID=6596 RepID=UPI00234E71BF|nr:amiloride-sensitive sodium channel subunit gamma-2-like [Mercenaria mercenaria]